MNADTPSGLVDATMSAGELARLQPIPAGEALPTDIVAAIRAEAAAERARGRPEWAGQHHELACIPEVDRGTDEAVEAFRPNWAELVYLPRLAPSMPRWSSRRTGRAVSRLPTGQALMLVPPAMKVLSGPAYTEIPSCGYPWSTVGRVFSGNVPNYDNPTRDGSGVLVGPNLMLTASHVVPWDHGPEGWWMRFVPEYTDGLEPHGRSFVQSVHGYLAESATGLDYVICKLYTPLGQRTGWMGTQSFANDHDYQHRCWIHVGYPNAMWSGPFAQATFNVEIEKIDKDANDSRELETHYSIGWGFGSAGGPLWGWISGEPRVIGVWSGSEWEVDPGDRRRVFAGGRPMVDLVKHGWAHWQ